MKALSLSAQDALETAAMRAFFGSPEKLVNGVRIIRDKMQIAAVYWSDNASPNDVEIALCDSRLTEKYSLNTVHAWLDQEKTRFPNECNIHKHGSDWPIVGFFYEDALEFLERCRSLRLGFLDKSLITSLVERANLRANASDKEPSARIALSNLLPQSHHDIIDLVSRAGVSVDKWYWKKDGSPAQTPRSNPNYCYNWAFGGGDQPAVICLWHSELTPSDGNVVFEGNLREHAARLSSIADTAGEAPDVRSRARSQAERAKQLDRLLNEVSSRSGAVKVIIVEGQRRSEESLGKESSVVKRRKLDTANWYVHRYLQENGDVLLVREVQAPSDHEDPPYVDQFSEVVAKRESVTSAFVRKKSVRDAVLARAQGACEICGMAGFATPSGAIYLETHHVVPLSEDGPDVEQNVVALCPNDHREAHFGLGTKSIREILVQRLLEIYPAAKL